MTAVRVGVWYQKCEQLAVVVGNPLLWSLEMAPPYFFLGGGMKFTGEASSSLLISSSLLSHQSSAVKEICVLKSI